MNTTVYDCDMSAGFGFAAGLPPPPPFFDDGRSVHFAVYVSFRRIFRPSHRADLPPFPPILGSLVVPRRAFFAAPVAVTLSILSAVGVAAPPGVLDHFAPRMSSFAWSAASAAAPRILPLCVHILAVTYPLTYSHPYNFGPSFPLTYHRNHSGGPGIRSAMARSPMDMTTRGYGYGYDYDYDYDRTQEVFDDAVDLVPLTPSTTDHAPENEAAFEEYFSSPESDEDGDENEDEDEDEDRDEIEDEDRDENEDEDREAESTEPDSLRFEYFFSSSEDEDEDEDEIEGFDDEEHSISTEARSGPSSATRRETAHAHGAVLDDDGGVLRNLFRSDDWEDDDDVSGFDGIGLRGLFRLYSDGESSDEASVQTDQTTRFSSSTVEGGEYSSPLSLLLDALSSLSRRRARDRTDRDQYFLNNSDGDRDDHAVDRNNDDDDDNDDNDDDDGIDGDYFDYDDDDDDINVEEFMLGVVPATKSSIEALEEVTTTTTTSAKDQCAICLEDFSSPIESNGHDYLGHDHDRDDQNKAMVVVVAVRMPCSHLYHKECIVQWLEKSHLCPLCRYSMPTFDDTTSDLSLEETSNAIGMTLNSRLRLVDVFRYAAFGERYRP